MFEFVFFVTFSMSHFEFVIPLQREELCNSSAGEYKVEDVLVLEKLEKAITGKTACIHYWVQ